MHKFIMLLLALLITSCSEEVEVKSDDWRRYSWMVEILGDEVQASQARHNLDTGAYTFVFSTYQTPDSAIAMFDKRARHNGWSVEAQSRLARIYVRKRSSANAAAEYRCISIRPISDADDFKFAYRPAQDC